MTHPKRGISGTGEVRRRDRGWGEAIVPTRPPPLVTLNFHYLSSSNAEWTSPRQWKSGFVARGHWQSDVVSVLGSRAGREELQRGELCHWEDIRLYGPRNLGVEASFVSTRGAWTQTVFSVCSYSFTGLEVS